MRVVVATLLSLGFAVGAPAQNAEIPWVHSYDEALAQARAEKKPLFVEFYADWCGPCKQMDADVYSQTEIIEALDGYVCAKVDVDAAMNVAAAYQVNSIPRFLVISADERIVGDQIGYVRKDYFLSVLDMIAEDIADGIGGSPIPDVKPGTTPSSTSATAPAPTAEDRIAGAEGLDDWLTLLGDVDPLVRKAAGTELANRGVTGAWILVEALASDYLGTRIGGFEALTTHKRADLPFDPWAEPKDRTSALRAWRTWRDAQRPAAPSAEALAKPIAPAATPPTP